MSIIFEIPLYRIPISCENWYGGVGTFASEIGPSSLFGAYQLIKTLENKGKIREEVVGELMDNFGEKNPEVNVMPT